jgi:hypothetical protein
MLVLSNLIKILDSSQHDLLPSAYVALRYLQHAKGDDPGFPLWQQEMERRGYMTYDAGKLSQYMQHYSMPRTFFNVLRYRKELQS